MNLVRLNAVSVEIPDALYLVVLTVQLNLRVTSLMIFSDNAALYMTKRL